MKKNTYCLFHSADHDGHASGAVVKRKYPDCIMLGVNYGYDLDLSMINDGDTVFVCDFCLDDDTMVQLNEKTNLIWIDHHISSIKRINELKPKYRGQDSNSEKRFIFKGLRASNNEYSGCELTWMYCYPDQEMPRWLKLLGRYDIFDLKYHKDVLPFHYGLSRYDTNPYYEKNLKIWNDLFETDIYLQILRDGYIIHEYQESQDKFKCKFQSFTCTFEGYTGLCIVGVKGSLVFNSKYNSDEYDLMIAPTFNGKWWSVSLYSTTIDTSIISTKYGGGGHKGASGFKIKNFFDIIEIVED